MPLLSPTVKIGETSTKYISTQESRKEDGRRTPPAFQPGASEHPQGSRVTRDEAGAGRVMAPVLSIIFRQLRRRPRVQGPSVWKAPGLHAGVVQEVLCPPSRPQDSIVEYGEGGPPAQVTWDLNKWSRTNRPTPVHTTWPRMQKGAPWTGHQKRGNRVALLCKRAQFAPKPGGSPLARSDDAAFILKTTVTTKVDLEDASAVRKVRGIRSVRSIDKIGKALWPGASGASGAITPPVTTPTSTEWSRRSPPADSS